MAESDGASGQLDFTMDKNNLYKEAAITDFKVGSIQMLTPIKMDGSIDEKRALIFLGRTQLNTPQGPIPIQAKLEADSIEKAVDVYPAAMQQETGKVVQQLRQLQEQQKKAQDSRIIVPGMSN